MKSFSRIFSYSIDQIIYRIFSYSIDQKVITVILKIREKSLLEKVLANNRILYVNLILLINQFDLLLKLLLTLNTYNKMKQIFVSFFSIK